MGVIVGKVVGDVVGEVVGDVVGEVVGDAVCEVVGDAVVGKTVGIIEVLVGCCVSGSKASYTMKSGACIMLRS